MIKPKTNGAYAIEAMLFHSLVDTYNNGFANGGKMCAFKSYFYLSPVLRIRKQFYFQVFFFYVSNLYNCFNCRSQSHSFHIFFNFGTFLTWKLQQIRSLSKYISFSTIVECNLTKNLLNGLK